MPSNAARLCISYIGELPPHPGGSAVATSGILSGLARRGHAVHAIAPITQEAIAGGQAYAARHPEVTTYRYLIPSFASAPNQGIPLANRNCDAVAAGRLIREVTNRHSPDIIIVNRESYFWTVPELSRHREVPKLLIVHGALAAGLARGEWPSADARELIESCRNADATIVVARHLSGLALSLGFKAPSAIPNGVDLDRFIPGPRPVDLAQTLDIDPTATVVTHISNMKRIKRPLDVVEAARIVCKRLPHALFLVVGDGGDHAELVERCRRYGLTDRFRFTGWIDHGHVADHIRLSDMVLLPSDAEGLALVGLETMACERVLIASDIPGFRELLVDRESGLLFPAGDVEALADRITAAGLDSALRHRIGKAARERVAGSSILSVVKAYETKLYSMVKQHRGSDA